MSEPYATVDGCASFLKELGDSVKPRARTFFELLDRERKVSSVDVADALGCEPHEIGANLTRWIRRLARGEGWVLPYDGGRGEKPYGGIPNPGSGDDSGRTYYIDRDGIASRMIEASGRLGI